MEAYTINIYPIFKIFVILFAVVGAYATINNGLHLLGRFAKDKLDNKKDIELLDKFPLVAPDFADKNTKEQNIENNQEIHELNKKYDIVEDKLNKIELQLNRLNLQQSMTLDEVKGKRK